VGSNSIVAYLLSWVMEAGIIAALNRHLGRNFFLAFGPQIEPLFRGAFVLAIFWLILYWMYRRKIFVRI
jgi:predicted acyltransferase